MATTGKMKVLILGANGMLGHKLYQVLCDEIDVCGTMRAEYTPTDMMKYSFYDWVNIYTYADVLSHASLIEIMLLASKPDVVINCIGVIDKATCEHDRLTTVKINTLFPQRLSNLCQVAKMRLIHISTDCVFSGREGNYTEESPADATDAYGKSKYLGEVTGDNVLTIRTSIIGRELVRSRGLLEWFISKRGGKVDGYSNAIFSGFPTVVFASIIKDIILNHPELSGLYHIASNPIDKYTLLNMINDTMHLGIKVVKQPAYKCDRSLNATKFNKATGFKPRPWSLMLDELAKDARQYSKWR